MGITIRKTPPRFPNFLGRRTNFPPHPDTSDSNLQQGWGRFLPRAPKSGKCSRIFTLPRQKHPPNTGKTPQYRAQFPSREGATTQRGRKRHPRDATGARSGSTENKGGGKFDPSRCGGHKNSENATTFSEILGQEDKLSPAPTTSRHFYRQLRLPEEHFHPPETKSPSQYRQSAPISTAIPISGGRNCTGRAKMSHDLGGADF